MTPPALAELLNKNTCCGRIAKLLITRRGEWISWRAIAIVGGGCAWRTRISNLRKAPWMLEVENRVLRVGEGESTRVISEYRVR